LLPQMDGYEAPVVDVIANLSLAVPPQAPSVDDTDVWKVMKSSLGSIL
jgi:hypothetical protein